MRPIDTVIAHFEHYPQFGNIDQLNDVSEWAKEQQKSWWQEKGPHIHTPQIGDIFCAYLICVGVCGEWKIEDAVARLEHSAPLLMAQGHTKQFWKEKLYRLLGISVVIVSDSPTNLDEKQKREILREAMGSFAAEAVQFIEHPEDTLCDVSTVIFPSEEEEEEKVRPEKLQ